MASATCAAFVSNLFGSDPSPVETQTHRTQNQSPGSLPGFFVAYLTVMLVPSLKYTVMVGVPWFQLEPFDMLFHCACVPLKWMLVRLEQPDKAQAGICVTLLGMVMLVRLVKAQKVKPMFVTLPSEGISLSRQIAISFLLLVSIKQFPVL
jgi:hypothetical protein